MWLSLVGVRAGRVSGEAIRRAHEHDDECDREGGWKDEQRRHYSECEEDEEAGHASLHASSVSFDSRSALAHTPSSSSLIWQTPFSTRHTEIRFLPTR